jgi:hypothetical protein
MNSEQLSPPRFSIIPHSGSVSAHAELKMRKSVWSLTQSLP